MRFRFSESPWDESSWFHGGEVVDGRVKLSAEAEAAIALGGAWGHCVAAMARDIADGTNGTNVGPHVVFETSKWWRW